MKATIIIPLAGPDFYLPDLKVIKPFLNVDGSFLIERILKTRNWNKYMQSDIVFVLRKTEHTEIFNRWLKTNLPYSRSVILSDLTDGALLSALSGIGLIRTWDSLLCIDLIDILYEETSTIMDIFANDKNVSGIIPYFQSNNNQYSYLELSGEKVIKTAEKSVISTNASAGTYWFRTPGIFLESLVRIKEQKEKYSVNNSLFVCPSYNELINNKKLIIGQKVKLNKCLSTTIKHCRLQSNNTAG